MSAVRDEFLLTGRRALVTGASGDIGRAIALALADHGASVALVARRAEILESVAAEVRSRGVDACVAPCDVTDADSVATAAAAVDAAFGGIDILVNNAGGTRFIAPPLDINAPGFRKTLDLNLTGPFLMSQAFGRGMIERKHGVIVNVGSVAGLRPLPGMGPYSMAKAGLFQQTKVLARDWAPHSIRVNAVAPGFVDTSGWAAFDTDAVIAEAEVSIPMRRWATADEVALPVVFLASPAAAYITGVTLVIDGGMLS